MNNKILSTVKDLVDKKISIFVGIVILIMVSPHLAYATNHTNTSIFSDSQKYADTNSYTDPNHAFSIQPPINWSVLKNIPPNVSQQALVIFSNNDKTQLATFGIYHRNIDQNVIDALKNHPDNDILATIAQEMSAENNDSKTIVYNGLVDRYNDGIRVAVSSATRYNADNSTTLSENIFYFLNNGHQYTLDLTSNSNNIDKNSQLFEDSANTFLVNQNITIPEFSFSSIILIISFVSIIFILRSSQIFNSYRNCK